MPTTVSTLFHMERDPKDPGAVEAVDLAIAERGHELAMSNDPAQAAQGRFVKEVMPAFMRWYAAELARAGTAGDATQQAEAIAAATAGLGYGLTNLLLSWGGGVAGRPMAAAFGKRVLEQVAACLDAGDGVLAKREAP